MKVFYSDQPLTLNLNIHSIFLAGPTPRSMSVPSWRPGAIRILESLGYKGQVIVPERTVRKAHIDYDEQVEWENYGTEWCSSLVFWVPRNLETMPAFTTNVEFGRYHAYPKTFYGRPEDAEKCRYLDWLYTKFNKKMIYNNLQCMLIDAKGKN